MSQTATCPAPALLGGGGLTVLLVDDDDVALEGVMRAFRKFGTPWDVVTANDGQEALEILRGEHPDKQLATPYLVLLDLNMPRMNGMEFMTQLRADVALSSTVVFVLTTSARDFDRALAYREHVAGYIVKSAAGPQFAKLAHLLQAYSETVRLPERPH